MLDLPHRTTDPACIWHQPPRGPVSRWRFDRNRGRSCERCMFVARYRALFGAKP